MSLRRRAFLWGGRPPQVLSWVVSTKPDPNAATYGQGSVAQIATAAGWDGESVVDLTITITSTGGLLGGLVHGRDLPEGSKVLLINQGVICGARGLPGAPGTASGNNAYAGGNGGNGRNALEVYAPITVQNTGVIAGGGGGGGGGGGSNVKHSNTYPTAFLVNGTAGGVGAVYGGTPATPADTIYVQYATTVDNVTMIKAGRGGAGGQPGAAGSPGSKGDAKRWDTGGAAIGNYAAGGLGGAPGNAVVGNAYITWLATGTRIGAIT